MRELAIPGICFRIFAAVLFGGIIGMERGKKNRPAGLRTYMLVCIGSCIVMITNQYIYQFYQTGDPVRLGAQVISGIGFLGAGTIVVTPHNQIKGLTTAAGLWAAACVGLALGLGLYEVVLAGGGAVYIVLAGMQKLDFTVRRKTGILDAYIELDKRMAFGSFVRDIRERDIELSNLQFVHAEIEGVVSFTVTFRRKKKFEHDMLIHSLSQLEGVCYIEEL